MAFIDIFTVVLALLFIIGLILGVFWLMRKIPLMQKFTSPGGKSLRVIHSQQIAGRAFLVELKWKSKDMLVLVTAGGGTLIASEGDYSLNNLEDINKTEMEDFKSTLRQQNQDKTNVEEAKTINNKDETQTSSE